MPCILATLEVLQVAPFMGAGIEGLCFVFDGKSYSVAPFTGAWIEMLLFLRICFLVCFVAPFTGAWIEISLVHQS